MNFKFLPLPPVGNIQQIYNFRGILSTCIGIEELTNIDMHTSSYSQLL